MRAGAVVGGGRSFPEVKDPLGKHDPPGRGGELLGVDVPPGDRGQQGRPLGQGSVNIPAEEVAQDHRVHHRRSVLGADGGGHVGVAALEAVQVPGEVGLVGPRAVVIGAPGVYGQSSAMDWRVRGS